MQHVTKECRYWTNNKGYIIFFFNILNLDQLQPCLCRPSIGGKIEGHTKRRCRYYDYNIKTNIGMLDGIIKQLIFLQSIM